MMALAIALALGALAGASIAVALTLDDYERRRERRALTYEQWRQLRFEGMADTIAAFAAAAFTAVTALERFAAARAAHERRLRSRE